MFLRVLQYYRGVLILTMNRVGQLDEAFKPRIHVSLYYSKLQQESTEEIWRKNIERLKNSEANIDIDEESFQKFYKEHWLETEDEASRKWNGRRIKNAFQTAIALANWEFYEVEKPTNLPRPKILARHFKPVANTSAHFDDYLADMWGIDDQDDVQSVLAKRANLGQDEHGQREDEPRRSETRRSPI